MSSRRNGREDQAVHRETLTDGEELVHKTEGRETGRDQPLLRRSSSSFLCD